MRPISLMCLRLNLLFFSVSVLLLTAIVVTTVGFPGGPVRGRDGGVIWPQTMAAK